MQKRFWNHIEKMLPDQARGAMQRVRGRVDRLRLSRMSRRDAFTTIYAEAMWDESSNAGSDFCSGPGSRDDAIVSPYVTAVSAYLSRLGKPDVADLGCGDFTVGSQLRPFCGRYFAADIVPPLIERNRAKYGEFDVDFQVLDIVAEALPVVDVIMIRQVLQHLSNDDIAHALERIRRSCRHLILTEHVPAGRDFPPNADHERGATIRLYKREPSGVVLTAPPFNLVPKHEAVLCEIPYGHPGEVSAIRTIAYEL